MNFKKNESTDKLRGGYYTPIKIARFLTQWVLKKKPKTILEPSCGDGQFLKSFIAQHKHKIVLTAIELMEEEANKARESVCDNKLLDCSVINKDFLEIALNNIDSETYDAVVGNPPYIRYQYLEKHSQELAKNIFDHFNLPFTKHTNAWVPFVIASVALLVPGGRLGMVIPSEILHVLHAKPLRTFLLEHCERILMIDPTDLLFDDALQGTVLLMLEKKKNTKKKSQGVAIISAPDNSFLENDPDDMFLNATYVSGDVLNGKWMKVLLNPIELEVFGKASKLTQVYKFSTIASVDVGIVTGANKFFLVDDETIKKYGLKSYAHPMFGRSEHCPGVIYNNQVHLANKEHGFPTNFLLFDSTEKEKLPKKVLEYITLGEKESLNERYKCRIRKPWYKVPSIYSTEIGMLKRSHNFPKLILNTINAFTTDTAYRIRMLEEVPAEKLVFCFINSLTALSAELEGRHYGGGVLELVPSEIEKLVLPIPDSIHVDLNRLDNEIKNGCNPHNLLKAQDEIILQAIGLTIDECNILHNAWSRIKYRRHRLVED